MLIPFSIPESVRLELADGEKILVADVDSSIVLTTSCIYLLHLTTVIAVHKRSAESIEKYGENFGFDRIDDLVIVRTGQDYLLLYTVLKATSRNELLTVYTPTSTLLQNGLVQDENGYNFFSKDQVEEPVLKLQLRFKLFLKITNGIVDVVCISKNEVLLITKTNVCLLNLNDDKNDSIEFEALDGKIVKATFEKNLLLVFNESNESRLYRKVNKEFKLVKDILYKNTSNAAINTDYNLIVLNQGNKLVYHNYDINSQLKEVLFEDSIKSIKWSIDGQTLIILYENGHWSLHSVFGSIFFSSKVHSDYNKDTWLSSVNSISIDRSNLKVFLSTSNELFHLRLLSTQSSLSNAAINHNQKRPILVSDSEIHIYSGYEMINTNSNLKSINWHIIKIPYEQFHQINIPAISQFSISTDSKFLALSNGTGLLLYSTIDNDWSFYINDYNHDMNIQNITWFDKLNLLIVINKTAVGSELIIFDFKKFDKAVNFDSNYVVFKYDFNFKDDKGRIDDHVSLINIVNDDLVILSKKRKLFYFKFELLSKSFKIDLIKVLSLEKLLKPDDSIQNLIKVQNGDVNNNDYLIHANGELIYLKQLEDQTYTKALLFDKVEYVHKINSNEYYLFNGESVLLLKDFHNLIVSETPESSILSIPLETQYPVLLILDKGLIVTLENELINKKQIQLNNINTKNSIFLHDLIKFELGTQDHEKVFHKYHKYKNFQYSLELLLYKTIINSEDLSQISKIIKLDPLIELHIISKCLRKIEAYHWKDLFQELEITPEILLNRSIELKQFKILGILIIIFLNYDQNYDQDDYKLEKDESKLINFLKLIYENAFNDDELWETGLEMLRFFKMLDPSGELLNKSIQALEEKR